MSPAWLVEVGGERWRQWLEAVLDAWERRRKLVSSERSLLPGEKERETMAARNN